MRLWGRDTSRFAAAPIPASRLPEVNDQSVRGERTTALVDAARSLQSRIGSVLAAGLILALGVSALTWYYTNALSRDRRSRQAAQATAVSHAQGEMSLPPLGRVEPAITSGAALPGADPPSAPSAGAVAEMPLMVPGTAPPPSEHADPPLVRGAAEVALDRRLSGGVLSRGSDSESVPSVSVAASGDHTTLNAGTAASAGWGSTDDTRRTGDHGEDALGGLLRASVIPTVPAQMLATLHFLLPRGSFIDCTLETAIDSTLPGMTTCITAADTFGADGKVVLLERGTKLVGETRGQVQQGQARVFVLWTEARTPAGVVVPLASPGTDELGRSGLPGVVERHFWQRFGAAMLISVIDGAVQAGVEASARPNGTVIYAPQPASQDVLTEVLKDTVSIAPTVVKHNGDRIQILVARDLDFRPVYELRAAAKGP